MIKIIIVDDHHLVVQGIQQLLSSSKEFKVVGSAYNGREALELLKKVQADVVLMDIHMPDMDGIEATKRIKDKYPNIYVIALTMSSESKEIKSMIRAGASGYLLKNTEQDVLMEAIEIVNKGQDYFPEEIVSILINSFREPEVSDTNKRLSSDLTDREVEILKLLANENTMREIGEKLFLSEQTVHTHRKNLMRKLGAKNAVGLVRYAIESGIVNLF